MCFEEKKGGVLLKVQVQPRASRNEIVGVHGDCLKVRITAPPVENRANEELCRYLSRVIGIDKKKIEIVGGQRGRGKKIIITGSSLEEVRKKLNNLI